MEQPVILDRLRSMTVGLVATPLLIAALAGNAFTLADFSGPPSPGPLPAEWKSRIESAGDDRHKCAAAVNAAQKLVKEQHAAAFGDWLLGRVDFPPARSGGEVTEALLAHADGLVARLPERDRKMLKARIAAIRRFDAVFAAIATTPVATSQPDATSLNDAAGELAEYLDDPNAALAESARLWQAAAYWRAGNPTRALKILRPIVADPAHPRIGFVSRLFRVHLLAESGQPAAALAHCTRIADRVDRWLDSESEETRASAHAAVRAVQLKIYEEWNAKLVQSKDEKSGSETVALRLAELKKSSAQSDAEKRFRLKTLVGGLGPIKLKDKADAAGDESGDKKTSD